MTKLQKKSWNEVQRKYEVEYVCDSASDVVSLPTNYASGSTAVCIDEGKIYILSPAEEWRCLK